MLKYLFSLILLVLSFSGFSQEDTNAVVFYAKGSLGTNLISYSNFKPYEFGLNKEISLGFVAASQRTHNYIFEAGIGKSHSNARYINNKVTDVLDVYSKYYFIKSYVQTGNDLWKYRGGLGIFIKSSDVTYRYRMYKNGQLYYDHTNEFMLIKVLPAMSAMFAVERKITKNISINAEAGMFSRRANRQKRNSSFTHFFAHTGIVFYLR